MIKINCGVKEITDVWYDGAFVPMAYVEVNEDKANIETIKADIMKRCQEELPDYEVPKYIECIEKIPYKNTKHNFKELEIMGEEYVKQLM